MEEIYPGVKLTDQECEFAVLSKKLMEWLSNNANDDAIIIIEPRLAKLVAGKLVYIRRSMSCADPANETDCDE